MPFHAIPCHSIPLLPTSFHSIPFHSIPFKFFPIHSIAFRCIPFNFIVFLPFHSIPFHSNPPPSVRPSERCVAAGASVLPLARSGRPRADGARGRTSPSLAGPRRRRVTAQLCLPDPHSPQHGNYPACRANSLCRVIVPDTNKGRLTARPPDPCHPVPKRAINHQEVTGPGWRAGKWTPRAAPCLFVGREPQEKPCNEQGPVPVLRSERLCKA